MNVHLARCAARGSDSASTTTRRSYDTTTTTLRLGAPQCGTLPDAIVSVTSSREGPLESEITDPKKLPSSTSPRSGSRFFAGAEAGYPPSRHLDAFVGRSRGSSGAIAASSAGPVSSSPSA